MKVRPCDCISIDETKRLLQEQGLSFNEWSILVKPNSVIISNRTTEIKIPMQFFKRFAEWYLEEQEAPDPPSNYLIYCGKENT